jgi:long-subunit fatty acid transport protein
MSIPTPAGVAQIPLVHVDSGGALLLPTAPAVPSFTAPTIFSAPLPSGSGARALGLAGAFTAIADDATAASWNPAGLTQLERPEFSLVYRLKDEQNRHWSGNDDYRVGDDDDFGNALNYLSAAMPVRLWDRNAVFSINFQEVFDFSQRFHANFADRTTSSSRSSRSETTPNQRIDNTYTLENGYINLTEFLTTHRVTTLDQRLSSSSLGKLSFEQEGSVQAISPAFAIEVTPTFSLGAAVNIYQEGLLGANKIRSHTSAHYYGTMDSTVNITDERTTSGTWSYTGEYVSPTIHYPLPPASGDVDPYSTTETSQNLMQLQYEGHYEVDDRIDDYRGINATLGGLWTVNEKLTLGGCLDLPWTAYAHQTKTVRADVDVEGDATGHTSSRSSVAKDITFDMPLYWALGAAWHWNNTLTTSFDVSQTHWSQYSFKADGEPRVNPLDGSRYGEHSVDDCWALRTGTEYLWVLQRTEIPLRAGLSWEQRPAIGEPDEYWGVSLGSGFSIGKGPNKVIIDIAYVYSWGNDVMGTLVPGQEDSLGTDVQRHDLYVSCIYHF